ncbi:HNH endonuclease [Caldisalinibacter kiritimatiensis]|uniref:HNH endonuclease family protein n=1 Tax=Caldisalinibacter kiritimatiensis TaxID=1304284 RepID=R1ASQ9_9FIRM|nr:HNH endonuclease [Caldisalinibacter kiritimatiensis]EOD00193.1 HNH endonuclease family protein [Caldisalinibacter kiritimatiensis]
MKLRNKDKLYIYYRDNKSCFYCGKSLKFKQITLDHFIPLSKGGTSDIFNVVTCCKKCNKLKADKMPGNYEDTILNLFLKTVDDDMIIGKGINISNKELKEELLKVDRLEDLSDQFIFQNSTMRFYIKDNYVIKIVYLGGYENEYNSDFSWED